MKHNNKIFSFIMIAVLFVTAFAIAVPTNAAYAGSNGQQIQIVAPSNINIKIQGVNQNNQNVVLTRNTGSTGRIQLSGYWWKGTLSISSSGRPTQKYAIPVNQPGKDWVCLVYFGK